MKKHILSNYLKRVKKIVAPSMDSSILTESTETSDPDEFRLDTTNETRSTETSDPDEFCVLNKYYDDTRTTFTLEQGDPDEFALS